ERLPGARRKPTPPTPHAEPAHFDTSTTCFCSRRPACFNAECPALPGVYMFSLQIHVTAEDLPPAAVLAPIVPPDCGDDKRQPPHPVTPVGGCLSSRASALAGRDLERVAQVLVLRAIVHDVVHPIFYSTLRLTIVAV